MNLKTNNPFINSRNGSNDNPQKKRKILFEKSTPESLVQIHKPNKDKKYTRFCIKKVEKTTSKQVLTTEEGVTIELVDNWKESHIKEGDFVNIISNKRILNEITISRDSNLLVVHPDLLLNVSKVSESYDCHRKGFFERFSPFSTNKYAIIGNILHRLFQMYLGNKDLPLEDTLKIITKDYIPSMVECEETEEKIETIFKDNFLLIFIKVQDFFERENVQFMEEKKKVTLLKVLDIEESIWSPQFGLKAKIDVSLEARIGIDRKIIPFELKTGKNYEKDLYGKASHRAQVIFYMLLMTERYEREVQEGLLYYVKSDQKFGVFKEFSELSLLIQTRNSIAASVVHGLNLNSMLKKEFTCKSCFSQNVCMIYHKTMENGTSESSGVKETFEKNTNNITESDSKFIRNWLTILDQESDIFGNIKIWSVSSIDKETKYGTCFSYMEVESETEEKTVLKKHKDSPSIDMKDSLILPGDYVILSTESEKYGVASGSVLEIESNKISLKLDHKLIVPETKSVLWRIDKRELPIELLRSNIIQLFQPIYDRKKKLIVDLVEPEFDKLEDFFLNSSLLNQDQRLMIQKAKSTKDYLIVNGCPGTGKSYTIAHMIKFLVGNGKKILLVSTTISSLDFVLNQLESLGVSYLKLEKKNIQSNSTREFREFLLKHSVFVSTALSTARFGFLKLVNFDYCIVDQAHQISLPIVLNPILLSKVFILVGDKQQLNPIQKTEKNDSLFKVLLEGQPKYVHKLKLHYRMNSDISLLLENHYFDEIKCAKHSISIQNISFIEKYNQEWMNKLFTKNVIFVSTDGLNYQEEIKFGGPINIKEATLIEVVLKNMLKSELIPFDFGVISLYSSQVKFIREYLKMNDILIRTVDQFQGMAKNIIFLSTVHSNEDKIKQEWKDQRNLIVSISRAKQKLIIIGSKKLFFKYHPDLMKKMVFKDWITEIKDNFSQVQKLDDSNVLPKSIKRIMDHFIFRNDDHKGSLL